MRDYTQEEKRERDRIMGSWSSPWYVVLFAVAFAVELLLWWWTPYMQLGWQTVLALSIVLASVPWIGSRGERAADAAALRRHPLRFAFLIPALALHGGMAAFYGPYWNSGSGGQTNINQLLWAWHSPPAMTALMLATAERPGDTSRDLHFLLRLGADPDRRGADGRYPLDAAHGVAAINALLDAGARRHSAAIADSLHRLAHDGEATTLQRLLALGVAPDTLADDDVDGYTAAHEAAYMDHAEALRVLLEAGADTRRHDRWGRDVVDHARRGHSASALAVIAAFDPRAGQSDAAPPAADTP